MDNLVSVVITTYNRPFNMLNKAINSVLIQSHTNLELILVDDNPKGNENRIDVEDNIKSLNDSRLIYIQHTANKGACVARNTGIENANGNYIAFLDDDDEWLPNKLELQLQKIIEENVGLVYCHSYKITLKNNQVVKRGIRAHRISGMVYDKLIQSNFIGSTSFVLVKKEALKNCGLFRAEMKSSQDYELWLRIAQKYRISYVDKPLVNYYIHESDRISSNPDNTIQGLEKIIELHMPYLKKHRRIYSLRKQTLITPIFLRYGFKEAFKQWWESFKLFPFNRGLPKILFIAIKRTINFIVGR